MNARDQLESLINDLNSSDRETNGQPKLPQGGRPPVQDLVKRLLVNRDELHAHIRVLQQRLDRPHRHAHFLPEDQTEAVVNAGLGALDDDALAALVLNPIALSGLYDEIDERLPPAWFDAMHEDGLALLKAHGRAVPTSETLVAPAGDWRAALQARADELLREPTALERLGSDNRALANELLARFQGTAPVTVTSPRELFVALGEAVYGLRLSAAGTLQPGGTIGTEQDQRLEQLRKTDNDFRELYILDKFAGRTDPEIASLLGWPVTDVVNVRRSVERELASTGR